MRCNNCRTEKTSDEFSSYIRRNGTQCTYHICKECYSLVQRHARIGTHPSPETREKQSAAKRGVKQSPEHIAKRVAKMLGRTYSLEHRQKISIANTGYKHSDEARRKMSIAKTGLKHTHKQCAKISQSNLGKHNGTRTDEQRAHISQGTKEGMSSPEVRKQCSERQRQILARNIYKIPLTEKIMKRILVDEFHMIENVDFKHQYYVKIDHPYVADFYIYARNLVVECDGDYWHSLPAKQTEDRRRENEMDAVGIKWIRFTETQLKKQEASVIELLSKKLELLQVIV